MPGRVAILTAASCLWCALLLVLPVGPGRPSWYLAWNLFLAGVPLLLAAVLVRFGTTRWAWPLGALWLLFFPNAPYLITDLVHLKERAGLPVWFDLLVFLSFGLVGLWMGFLSLRLVQECVSRRSSAGVGWLFAVGVLGLSGFAIYVGRFLRWNSWDALSRPHVLVADVIERLSDPAAHGRTLGVTLGFGGMLTLAYLFWTLAAPPAPTPPSRGPT